MKKRDIIFTSVILLTVGCGAQSIERSHEGGVEVVLNHVQPYRISEQPSALTLEEVLTLDTEDPDVAAAGLVDIAGVQVDSAGGIYLLSRQSENHFFFKFSPEGRFVTSFGPKGQGPGEMAFPLLPRMLPRDRLTVTDVMTKLLVFDTAGSLVSETRIDPNFVIVNPLDNGSSVVFWKAGAAAAEDRFFKEKVSLFGQDGEEIQELDALGISRDATFLDPVFAWRARLERIYLINEQRGYEILVFDGKGSQLRKIRKQYEPVPLTSEIRDTLLEGISGDSPLRAPDVMPDSLPPLHTLFADEEGRIYAVTFEQGERWGEFWTDVFTREGVFFTRVLLPVQFSRDPFPIYALARDQHVYCVGEKENGFQRLKVFRMVWE